MAIVTAMKEAIVGPQAPGAGADPGMAPAQDKNSLSGIQEILGTISKSDIDAVYVAAGSAPGQPIQVALDMNKVEMLINKYATDSANPQLYNKWLGIETTLTKALGKFSMDLKILLAGATQMGQAQTLLQSQIPGEGEAGGGVATPGGQAQGGTPNQAPSPEQGKFGATEKALPMEGR